MRFVFFMAVSGLLGTLAFSLPGAAQESNTLILAGEDFDERFAPPTQFNRVPVAGLHVHAAATDGVPVLRILVPETSTGREFCVRAITADGFYEAVNTFLLPEGFTGGVGLIPFGTRQPDKLAGLEPRELGIAVLEGPCRDGGGAQKIVPAFWNADPGAVDAPASLAVNSMRAERVFLYLGDTGSVVVCEPIDGPVRHNFDTVCNFDLSDLPAGEDTVLRIVAVADQRPRPEEEVTVHRARSAALP
jgi:hypothetical protein